MTLGAEIWTWWRTWREIPHPYSDNDPDCLFCALGPEAAPHALFYAEADPK
jgi:hypothetical protein